MLFLLTDSAQKLKLEKIPGALITLCYVSLSSPQFQRLLFLLETQKATTLLQVTGVKTINLALKMMLEIFLKIFTFSRI